MTKLSRRVASFAALLVLAAGLVACGDSEADQRKAFIAFLQEILARPGVHFLNPKPDEVKSFGDYAQHYVLITDLNRDMKKVFQGYEERLRKLGLGPAVQPRSIEQMAAHRDDIVTAQAASEQTAREIDALIAKVTAARAALKQPDDLKTVYDKVFDRLVIAPVKAMKYSYQTLHDGFGVSLRLVDYINSHRDKLILFGSQIRAKDRRTLDEVGALLKEHGEAGKRFQEAQRAGNALLSGR